MKVRIASMVLGSMLIAASACGTSTDRGSAGGQAPLTEAETEFVFQAAKVHAAITDSNAVLILSVKAMNEQGWTAEGDRKARAIVDSSNAMLESWQDFRSPSDRLVPAIEAWFVVLNDHIDFLNAFTDLHNDPGSKALLAATLRVVGRTGDDWRRFKDAVMRIADDIPDGTRAVRRALNQGLEEGRLLND